jgi:hypothetical protein
MTTHTHSNGPDSSLPIALGITGLLLAAACWGMLQSGHEGAPPSGLVWPEPMQLDAVKLRADEEGRRQTSYKLIEEPGAKALIEAAHTANDHQFTTHPIPSRTAKELVSIVNTAAAEGLMVSGQERFLAIGVPVFAACTEQLDAMLKALGEGKISWEVATTDPDPVAWALYRQNCGNILPELLRTKLIDEKGHWRDALAPLRLELWQRYRWAFMIQEQRPALLQLSALEREALLRWRIEDGVSFPTEARLRALDEARDLLPDYPAPLVHALILREAGDDAGALASLRAAQAAHPEDRYIAGWIAAMTHEK